MRKLAIGLGLWALSAATAVSATPPQQEMPKLTVGAVFPLTGDQSPFGKEAMRGIEIGQELLLQSDPDLAGRISVVSTDDRSTAKDAEEAAKKLIQDRTHVILGSLTSQASAAMATWTRKSQIPLVAPLATQTTLTAGTPVFRSCFDEIQQAEILANFAISVLQIKKAATLRDDTITAKAFAERFASAFKAAGGAIVGEEIYDLAVDNHAPSIKKLNQAGAELIATPAAYQTAAALIEQTKKINPKIVFVGGDSWDTAQMGKLLANVKGTHYFVTHFAVDDPAPETQNFVKAFKAKFGRSPGIIAALTFDAYNLIAASFKQVNSNLKGNLNGALTRTKSFVGATGSLGFADDGETFKMGVVKQIGTGSGTFKARVDRKLAVITAPPTASAAPVSTKP